MSERTGANTPEPMPEVNEHTSIQSLVRRDLDERERAGIAKYGTSLQPYNGRDPLVDLYQELLDATCYVRQVIEEERTGTWVSEEDLFVILHQIENEQYKTAYRLVRLLHMRAKRGSDA